MFYKLIQRALPGWFHLDSLHVMQLAFTKKARQTIAEDIGTIKQYTTPNPALPRPVCHSEKALLGHRRLERRKNFRGSLSVASSLRLDCETVSSV